MARALVSAAAFMEWHTGPRREWYRRRRRRRASRPSWPATMARWSHGDSSSVACGIAVAAFVLALALWCISLRWFVGFSPQHSGGFGLWIGYSIAGVAYCPPGERPGVHGCFCANVRELKWPLLPWLLRGPHEYGLVTPLWIPLAFTSSAVVAVWRLGRRPPVGHCRRCGYDLTGNLSGRCPECAEIARLA